MRLTFCYGVLQYKTRYNIATKKDVLKNLRNQSFVEEQRNLRQKKSRGSNEGETIQQCQTHSAFEKKLPASACIDFVCLNPEPRNLTQAMKASMPNNTVTFLT